MRIATWNIGGGFVCSEKNDAFDVESLDYFINELKAIEANVICLQEVHISEKTDQSALIAKALGFEFMASKIIANSHIKDGEGLAISIISKYPIVVSDFKPLTNPNLEFVWKEKKAFSHDKGFVLAKVRYRSIDVSIFSGHMVPFWRFGKDFLSDEFSGIRKEIEEILCKEKVPTIVGADMNFSGDINDLIPGILYHGLQSVLGDMATTPTDETSDRIFISKDWKCTHSEVVQGNADHYLCYADIELVE